MTTVEIPTSHPQPSLKLSGADGNVFNIFGLAKRAAKKAGWTQEQIDALMTDFRSGSYDEVLQKCMRYFDVS